MRTVRCIKAQACGNDFLIVEGAALSEVAARSLAMALCARTTGLGADGIEYLTWTGERSGIIRLRNADGSVAEISGNGTRCVAAWMAHSKGAQTGETLTLQTDAGIRDSQIVEQREPGSYLIAAYMGVPVVTPRSVALDEDGVLIDGAVVSTGNPHFVLFVEDESFRVHGVEWQVLGRALCTHPEFPEGTNVEFVHVRGAEEIALRIFERGVGPTSSSGTGTCAAAAAAIALRGCATTLRVEAPGGMQQVQWPARSAEMLLTGPATIVAVADVYLPMDVAE